MQQYINVITSMKETREIDANVSRVFTSLISNPLLGTISIVKNIYLLSDISMLVSHKLGKAVTGFIVINSDAPAIVYQSTNSNISPTSYILLESNEDVTVDILFF